MTPIAASSPGCGKDGRRTSAALWWSTLPRRCTPTTGSGCHFQGPGARSSTRTRPCTGVAMSETAATSGRWTRVQFPREALLFHPLQQFFSSRSANLRLSAGAPHPLGATWDGRGTNFALFSANAEKVELCLSDNNGRREIERIALPERTEDVWHGYLNDIAPGQPYGYRVHGPYNPERGHRFNAHKLLVDPYAKELRGRLVWSDAHFGYRAGSARADLSFDRRDNGRGMPKAVVIDEAFSWGEERRPTIPWEDAIIYEAHVKGL